MSIREGLGFIICPCNYTDFEGCEGCMYYREDKKCYNPRIDETLDYLKGHIEQILSPYPESVFPPADLSEASVYLQNGGFSPDSLFGNWGRQVFSNTIRQIVEELEEE